MTNNAIIRRTIQETKQADSLVKEDTRHIVPGLIVEVNGSIVGPRTGLVWFKAFTDNTAPRLVRDSSTIADLRANMAVLVERDPRGPYPWKLIRFDRDRYFAELGIYDNLPGANQQPHRDQHEWLPGRPGADVMRLYPRALTEFQVQPTSPASMLCVVNSGWYQGADNWERFKGPVKTQDFTATIPVTVGAAVIVAIGLDNTGTFQYYTGTEFPNGLVPTTSDFPDVAREVILISAVKLYTGQTTIVEADFEFEMRPLMASGDATFVRSGDDISFQDGEVNIGLPTGQSDGQFHWYQGIGGAVRGTLTDVNATPQTILIDGTYDIQQAAAFMRVLVRDSTGGVTSTTTTVSSLPTNFDVTPSGGNTIRFTFVADGSVTATRQAGSETFDVVYDLLYL